MLLQLSAAGLCKYKSVQLDYVNTTQHSWTMLLHLSTAGLY